MKKEINRERVLEIVAGDAKLRSLPGSKFNYALIRNMKGLKAEVETMKESNPQSEEMKKYEEELQEIVSSEAQRDKDGNFIPVGPVEDRMIKIKPGGGFQKKMDALNAKYKEALAEANKKEEEFKKFCKEPFEFDFFQIPIDCVPNEISREQMDLVLEMIQAAE